MFSNNTKSALPTRLAASLARRERGADCGDATMAHSASHSRPLNGGLSYRLNVGDRNIAYRPVIHWLALLTAIATFPLICMGGLVTSHHAGMSVPDWPNSYGYNMFLFPPNRWVGGIFYEHTHRLMGTVVGMLSIALVLFSWRSKYRSLALAVLGAVIFQGVLGGLRVVLVKLNLAIVHACVAQAFFCLAGYAALVTSKWWQNAPVRDGGRSRLRSIASESAANPQTARGEGPSLRGIFWLGVATVGVVYLQLMVGATMRHYDAGLAIADVPFVYGKWLPPVTAEALQAINHLRAFQMNLDPVTMTQIWLAFAHRCGAVLVTAFVLLFTHKAFWRRDARGLAVPAILLVLLLATQITLGVLTVLWRKPADLASLHVAVGALVLLTSFLLTMRISRLIAPNPVGSAPRTAPAPGQEMVRIADRTCFSTDHSTPLPPIFGRGNQTSALSNFTPNSGPRPT